jgi:triphosphoribosyl-dephospho-CoA synthetase
MKRGLVKWADSSSAGKQKGINERNVLHKPKNLKKVSHVHKGMHFEHLLASINTTYSTDH